MPPEYERKGNMLMELKPGTRLRSVVCSTEVVVVKSPSQPGRLECGNQPMVDPSGAAATTVVSALSGDGTSLGKRYFDAETGIEVLCTKGGDGSVSLDGRPLEIKGAKPLPASD